MELFDESPTERRTWQVMMKLHSTMNKVRHAIRLVERNRRVLVRTRGSHRQYRHSDKRGTVTVAGKPGDDLPRGSWASVMKQAGLKE